MGKGKVDHKLYFFSILMIKTNLSQAQTEEVAVLKKCSTPNIYKSSALLTINKLRKEALGNEFIFFFFKFRNNILFTYLFCFADAGNVNTEK